MINEMFCRDESSRFYCNHRLEISYDKPLLEVGAELIFKNMAGDSKPFRKFEG
jgi:hypothetical protein